MLPMKVITGEHESKYGGVQPRPGSFGFNAATNATLTAFTDSEDSSNNNSPDLSSTPYFQPRTVPSPISGLSPNCSSGIRSPNQISKLSSLNFLKFGTKPSRSYSSSSKSNPASPRKFSRAAARHTLFGSSLASSHSRHQRSSSHAPEGFDQYKPQQPVSPTPSTDSISPVPSSFNDPFLGNDNSPSINLERTLVEDMTQASLLRNRSHLDEEFDYNDENASYQYRDTPKSHNSYGTDGYRFDDYPDEEDEDIVRLSNADVMLNSEGFYLVEKDNLSKQAPSLSERRKQAPIRPLHSINNSLSRRPLSRYNVPASPPISEPSMLNSRGTSIASISDDPFPNGHEVEEKPEQFHIPEILRSRLPTFALGRESGSGHHDYKHTKNVAAMDNMDLESLEELQDLMNDMNCMDEHNVDHEVQLLMSQMTQGQNVVRKPEEVPENEAVRSPQVPPPECCRYSPRDTSRPISRPMVNALSTPFKEEIDEEMAKEIQMLMEELAYTPAKAAPYCIGTETPSRVRSMAESEGLNEMPSEIEVDLTLPNPDDSNHPQTNSEFSDEHGLGQGLSLTDLDFLDDMLNQEVIEYELQQQQEQLVVRENLKAVADFDALRLETIGLRPANISPDTSPIDNASPTIRATSSSSNKSGISGTTITSSTRAKSIQDKTRKHNLKDNEVRVEDPAYLTAFKHFLRVSVHSDAFVSKQPRFDATQTRRICNEISHEYRPLPPPPHEMVEPQSVQDPTLPVRKMLTPEQRRVKEVTEEITIRMWVFAASRWLNYGRLLVSPAHELLYQSSLLEQRRPKNRSISATSAKSTTRRKVLDLGGAPVADWGWYCAYEYPHSKVYTVTSRPKNINVDNVEITGAGVIEKRRFRGPSNHRHIKVSSLWHLPFPDNHFDVISARSLHTILKQQPPVRKHQPQIERFGKRKMDEYALTIRECYRVLKPGGHFEFNLTDADLLRAGPVTQQVCERFTTDLIQHGYDPNPTTRWLSRLHRAGFQDVQRTWTLVPMAPPSTRPALPPKRDLSQPPANDLQKAEEEMRQELEKLSEKPTLKGTTKDVACISGLVGNWRWEEWMIKLDGERAMPEGKKGLVKSISPALEEGREYGSAWRQLVGWAKKPTKREKALRI